MHDQLKKRLVGGAVLVALVVIFLPMLLEDESPLDQGFSSQPIPTNNLDQDGFQSRTLPLPGEQGGSMPSVQPLIEPPPVFLPERGGEVSVPMPEPITPVAPLPQAKPTAPSPTAETLQATRQAEAEMPKPQPRPAAKPAPQGGNAQTNPVATPKPPARPVASIPAAGDERWVIQVASLTNDIRAEQLAVKLRAANYPAFVESAEVEGRTWHRVRVGPNADRLQLESLLSRLQSESLIAGMNPKIISSK